MTRAKTFEAVLLLILVILCAAMLVMVMQGPDNISDRGGWNVSVEGPVSTIHMSEDGTLYLFGGAGGNTIYAMGPDGDKKWALQVPDKWVVSKATYATGDGVLYLYLYEYANASGADYLYMYDRGNAPQDDGIDRYRAALESGSVVGGNRSIMAVSDRGRILWQQAVSGEPSRYGGPSIYASAGNLYYYGNDSVTVYDRSGRQRFTVADISGVPTVDGDGNVYVIGLTPYPYAGEGDYIPGVLVPGHEVEAYFPNGTLYWRTDMGQTIYQIVQYQFGDSWSKPFNSVLMYQDGALYAWVRDGVVKLSTNGSIVWSKTFPYNGCAPLEAMPMDAQGNMYFLFSAYPQYIDVVTPDGLEILRDVTAHNATLRGNRDGVVYYVDYFFDNATIDRAKKPNLVYANLSAYDILADRYLWNYTIAPEAAEITVVDDRADLFQMFGYTVFATGALGTDRAVVTIDINRQRGQDFDEEALMLLNESVACNWGIYTAPGNGVLYLNYYAFNWQAPIIKGQSTYFYANSLYAIADNGTLLWEKPLGSLVTAMAANNSTLYYSTSGGGFFVENAAKIGGGLAVLAIVYMLARFFVLGSVARARSRLDKNENRNSVMQYIVANPGVTARDIARGLGVNLGTVRYHLLILDLNHKIVTYKADGKYIRFFTNSKSYSKEEQQAVSLIKRAGMRKVLDSLLERPGLTSRELALALDAQESAISRNLRELSGRGIVEKVTNADGSPAYNISGSYREHIAFALERVKN